MDKFHCCRAWWVDCCSSLIKTVRRLADDANRLRGEKELEDIQKPLSDALKTIAEIFKLQEEMMRRNAYISASGGLFIDKTYKYLRKQDRRKR